MANSLFNDQLTLIYVSFLLILYIQIQPRSKYKNFRPTLYFHKVINLEISIIKWQFKHNTVLFSYINQFLTS